jgi:hypothetical protein
MNKALADIKELLEILRRLREMFPSMKDDMIGKDKFRTAGSDVTYVFSRPLKKPDIDSFNAVGHWVNESFIVRLFASLQGNHIVSGPIDRKLSGGEHVNIVKRLRDKIAHKSCRNNYNPSDNEEKKLFHDIVNLYKIKGVDPERASQYPLSIDTVLLPMTEGCIAYVQARSGSHEP